MNRKNRPRGLGLALASLVLASSFVGCPLLKKKAAADADAGDDDDTTAVVDAATVTAAWPYVMSDKKRTLSAVKLPIVSAWGEGKVVRVELDALKDAVLAG